MLTATFSDDGYSVSYINNGTHNVTLNYTYDNGWINEIDVDGINDILDALNITISDIPQVNLNNLTNIYQLLNISSSVNLTRYIMNQTGLTFSQLEAIAETWNEYQQSNSNVTNQDIESFLNNITSYVNSNLAQLNLTQNETIKWTESMANTIGATTAFLNFTYIQEQVSNEKLVSGAVPRWYLLANATAGKTSSAVSAIVLAIESQLELDNNIGRSWKNVPALEGNQVFLFIIF